VLVDKGFGGWGVNSIARAAGCDKQLIYRYFGGLDGLAKALGTEVAHEIEEALSAVPEPTVSCYADLVAGLLEALIHVLRTHPVMQRIIAWELSEANALTIAFAEARGRALGVWISRVRGNLVPPPGLDAPAVNAVLIASVQQMVLSSATAAGFAGVPLREEADWNRITRAIRLLVQLAYAEPAPAP
jgi:AcrR family transcriptional regulator